MPLQVLTEPTQVERLVIAGQGFGLGTIAAGTPEFRDFSNRRFAAGIEPIASDRLFLSRSELPLKSQGALFSKMLDDYMADAGYEIYAPETHSLEDQIARLKGARMIAGLDGSVFHLLGMVARPDQKIAILLRRNSFDFETFRLQFKSLRDVDLVKIGRVTGQWVPDRHYYVRGWMNFGEVDLTGLYHDLIEQGFIGSRTPWVNPRHRFKLKTLEGLGRLARAPMVRIGPDENPTTLKHFRKHNPREALPPGDRAKVVQPTSSSPEKK